jgi:hypothetical protein
MRTVEALDGQVFHYYEALRIFLKQILTMLSGRCICNGTAKILEIFILNYVTHYWNSNEPQYVDLYHLPGPPQTNISR